MAPRPPGFFVTRSTALRTSSWASLTVMEKPNAAEHGQIDDVIPRIGNLLGDESLRSQDFVENGELVQDTLVYLFDAEFAGTVLHNPWICGP